PVHDLRSVGMSSNYTIGLDFGSNSVRALIVDVRDGRELGSSVSEYAHGEHGIVLDRSDPDLARQHPADYLRGIAEVVRGELKEASKDSEFSAKRVIGLGVDTTGSTPMPVDASGKALALLPQYESNPNAMAWLWKDHTSHEQAEKITALAGKMRPQY